MQFKRDAFRPLLPTLFAMAVAVLFSSAGFAESGTEGRFSAAFSSFTGKPSLEGDWSIAESEGALGVEFGADFRARKAPDLKVFLSPKAPDAITGKNATEGSLNLGLLQSFAGAQRFAIPAGTDLSKYQALVVHCEEYSKLWGTSPLASR